MICLFVYLLGTFASNESGLLRDIQYVRTRLERDLTETERTSQSRVQAEIEWMEKLEKTNQVLGAVQQKVM